MTFVQQKRRAKGNNGLTSVAPKVEQPLSGTKAAYIMYYDVDGDMSVRTAPD